MCIRDSVFSSHEFVEDPDEVLADGAADAPVVHLEDLFFGLHDETIVNADFAEFVLDDGDALAVLGCEDVVDCAYDVESRGRYRGGQYGDLLERGSNTWVVERSAGQRRVSPSVVFPAPRKPVMIVTGVLSLTVILLDGVGRRVGRLGRRLLRSAPKK